MHDLVDVARQQRALFAAHPWLIEAERSLRVLGPHVLDHLDWGLAVLTDLDVPASRKMEAIALANGVAALFATNGRLARAGGLRAGGSCAARSPHGTLRRGCPRPAVRRPVRARAQRRPARGARAGLSAARRWAPWGSNPQPAELVRPRTEASRRGVLSTN
ncbi:hypothetical protein GCM10025868_27220 [Angustibacter aerolatus]|uniref:PIN domain-containing protein n=1 Tax=Angustibacter aerolatus TaxID=1162965 RepID=A0ABQ6JI94_9ACTN|nr:hypothetical protein [Angustibacter aerolatus]GMA87472.1 hypothetical protein GCM10025868_27220 [Angustibacter aerolatus]